MSRIILVTLRNLSVLLQAEAISATMSVAESHISPYRRQIPVSELDFIVVLVDGLLQCCFRPQVPIIVMI